MIILLAALSSIAADLSKAMPAREARASVVIVRGSEVSSKTWKPATQPSQRVIIRIEKDGQQVLIRLTEFE
jgi:hypothetical protein